MTADLPCGTRVADYVVDEVIGRGGTSVVYRATHPVIGSRVAIKVLADHSEPRRFFQEARTVNEIGHRNIVNIYTLGSLPDGQIYCVMELLEGVSLSQHLRDRGALGIAETLRILEPIARALDAAHAKGVVHRDVKPGNIQLVAGGEAKLLDFGVAKLLGRLSPEQRTESGGWVGTPAYMSPEQWHGKEVDARADVYALGAVAYHMLTGRLPYDATSVGELVLQQQAGLPQPASQRASLPPAIDAVLECAMANDPAKRFANASQLVAAIATAQLAPAVARRRMRRMPFVVAFAALALAIGGIALWRTQAVDDAEPMAMPARSPESAPAVIATPAPAPVVTSQEITIARPPAPPPKNPATKPSRTAVRRSPPPRTTPPPAVVPDMPVR